MIKRIVSFLIFSLITLNCFSQSLEGIWKGTFTARFPGLPSVNKMYLNNLKIEFILNKDSSYKVFSYRGEPYGLGDGTTHICEMSYIMLTPETLFLEEIKTVKPENALDCLKKMTLKITVEKKTMLLEGAWLSTNNECDDNGNINLYKKNK